MSTERVQSDDIKIQIRIISATVAVVHFLWCIWVANTPSEGSWQWFFVFIVDFPASLVPLILAPHFVPPLLLFGVTGSLWWYFVVRTILRFVKKVGRTNVA